MLKTIILWIKYVFVLDVPFLTYSNYAKFTIEGNSYFVFSWKITSAHKLKIKSLKYESFLKSGSAYIAINENVDLLEIIVSNSWRNRKYLLKIHRIDIDEPIKFPANFQSVFEAKVIIPNLKQKFSNVKLSSFKVTFSDKKPFKRIINISYPN